MILQSLLTELESVPLPILERWNRSGSLEIPGLVSLISSPTDTSVISPDERTESPSELLSSEHYLEAGFHSLTIGETSLCVLHDGNIENLKRLVKESYPTKHIWVITPESSLEEVKQHLDPSPAGLEIFTSFTLPSLTPAYGIIWNDEIPLSYDSQCGDVYGILSEGGTLEEFNKNGGKYILFTHSSSPSVTLHPLLSHHISMGVSITTAVCKRIYGYPLLTEDGLIEEGNIIGDENLTFSAMGTYVLPSILTNAEIPWEWMRSRRIVNGSITIEFHRHLSQLTRILPTCYVMVSKNI